MCSRCGLGSGKRNWLNLRILGSGPFPSLLGHHHGVQYAFRNVHETYSKVKCDEFAAHGE